MTFFTIQQIKDANKAAGHFFFSPSTMTFFRSRVLRGVIGGHYFITSEQFDASSPRLYTVRRANDDGTIEDASEFQAFDTPNKARTYARSIATGS
jgi:hypothetical protein